MEGDHGKHKRIQNEVKIVSAAFKLKKNTVINSSEIANKFKTL